MASGKAKTSPGMSTLERRHPEHVRAIGMISIENANLEHSLARLFATMLFISVPVGHAIYLTPKSAIARIEIFENAAKRALQPDLASCCASAFAMLRIAACNAWPAVAPFES